MGYLHIPNLYRPEAQSIFEHKECYVMEKIHGTSAHVAYKQGQLRFFSGGEKHENFMNIFDKDALLAAFTTLGADDIIVYGEAYGGKCQGMSATYGTTLKFVVFDVKINGEWQTVPEADRIATILNLEFVWWIKTAVNLELFNQYRDQDSVQAVRNGCGPGHHAEGIIIRPLLELKDKHDNRVIAKHKRLEFSETKTPRVVDAGRLAVIADATKAAEEWVTPIRLNHVLDKLAFSDPSTRYTKEVITAMIEDVRREAAGEVKDDRNLMAAIGKRTALLFKEWLNSKIQG